MAGMYFPQTKTFPNGPVLIQSTDATSYNQILNSMGGWVYLVSKIYLNAQSLSQLLQGIFINQFDVNGNIAAFQQIIAIDPYQYQNSLKFRLSKDNVVLNGRASLSFTILPNETLQMILYTKALQSGSYMPPLDIYTDDIFKGYAKKI